MFFGLFAAALGLTWVVLTLVPPSGDRAGLWVMPVWGVLYLVLASILLHVIRSKFLLTVDDGS